jgi:hypothetical protein
MLTSCLSVNLEVECTTNFRRSFLNNHSAQVLEIKAHILIYYTTWWDSFLYESDVNFLFVLPFVHMHGYIKLIDMGVIYWCQSGGIAEWALAHRFLLSLLLKHILFLKIFYQIMHFRQQASNFVRGYGEDKKIKSFLGIPEQEEEYDSGQLKKIHRTASRKPMVIPSQSFNFSCNKLFYWLKYLVDFCIHRSVTQYSNVIECSYATEWKVH